jgi:hypothetical protein
MCKKVNYKTCNTRIDKCMKNICNFIDKHTEWKCIGSCCGHKKYNPSILVQHPAYKGRFALEIFSRIPIQRKRRFYKRDKQGYYYIPEVIDAIKRNKK